MTEYTLAFLNNVLGTLLIAVSLHGCTTGHDIWGFGVFAGTLLITNVTTSKDK